jgi:hypothetical protein
MNKHLFIPPTSCHPPHTFKGWIVGSARRLRLNNETVNHQTQFLNLFESSLKDRGYKEKKINSYFNAVPDRKTIFTSILSKNKTLDATTKDIGTPFVITYTPAVQASLDAIKRAIAITEEATLDPHYPLIFSASTTPLLSFKRGKNLRDLVAPSTLS